MFTSWFYVATLTLAVADLTAGHQSLQCHSCMLENDPSCKLYNFTVDATPNTEQCQNRSYKCSVWHFYSALAEPAKTYYFERGCRLDCNPGCTPLEDMGRRFVSCQSCCTEDHCNVDNSAAAAGLGLGMQFLVLLVRSDLLQF